MLPAAAFGAGGEAPGALKKTTTTEPSTPAAPIDAAPDSGQAQGQAGGGSDGGGTGIADVPVTKGTVKKLTTTTQAQARSEPATSAAPTTATRRTSRTPARAGASSASRSSRRAARRHARSARRSAPAAARRTVGTTTARPAAAAVAPARTAKRKPAATAKSARSEQRREAEPGGPLRSIDRVADQVIEVIPGVVVLALAGLTTLVLLLVLRSWLTERRRSAALRESYAVTVQALATAIEAKDHTTGGHIERVRELGLLLARQLAPRDAKNAQMSYGFLLHDIGKLAIPDAILRKPGRLSEEEWALMRRHPEEGVRILQSIPFLDRALDVVRHHHERWDGGGYPDGLAGADIPLWARIFAVVDAVDAMTAERPYRARQPYPVALAEIERNSGTQFDPAVVEALASIEPAEVERLLEPAQVLDRVAGLEPPELEPLEAILAATEAARVAGGDVAPANGDGAAANGDGAHRRHSVGAV